MSGMKYHNMYSSHTCINIVENTIQDGTWQTLTATAVVRPDDGEPILGHMKKFITSQSSWQHGNY